MFHTAVATSLRYASQRPSLFTSLRLLNTRQLQERLFALGTPDCDLINVGGGPGDPNGRSVWTRRQTNGRA